MTSVLPQYANASDTESVVNIDNGRLLHLYRWSPPDRVQPCSRTCSILTPNYSVDPSFCMYPT